MDGSEGVGRFLEFEGPGRRFRGWLGVVAGGMAGGFYYGVHGRRRGVALPQPSVH